MTARVIKSGRGRKRPAAGEEPVGGDDMPVQDVGDGDVPRGSAEPENPDEEEEEDPVWQEFSQEYYEGESPPSSHPILSLTRVSQWWNSSPSKSTAISHSFAN